MPGFGNSVAGSVGSGAKFFTIALIFWGCRNGASLSTRVEGPEEVAGDVERVGERNGHRSGDRGPLEPDLRQLAQHVLGGEPGIRSATGELRMLVTPASGTMPVTGLGQAARERRGGRLGELLGLGVAVHHPRGQHESPPALAATEESVAWSM